MSVSLSSSNNSVSLSSSSNKVLEVSQQPSSSSSLSLPMVTTVNIITTQSLQDLANGIERNLRVISGSSSIDERIERTSAVFQSVERLKRESEFLNNSLNKSTVGDIYDFLENYVELPVIKYLGNVAAFSERGKAFAVTTNVLSSVQEKLREHVEKAVEIQWPERNLDTLVYLEQLQRMDPKNMKLKEKMARHFFSCHLYDETENYYKELPKANDDWKTWNEYISTLIDMKKYEEAEREVMPIIARIEKEQQQKNQQNQYLPSFYYSLGKALGEQNKYKEAIEQLTFFEKSYPSLQQTKIKELTIMYQIKKDIQSTNGCKDKKDIEDKLLFKEAMMEFMSASGKTSLVAKEMRFWFFVLQCYDEGEKNKTLLQYIHDKLDQLISGKAESFPVQKIAEVLNEEVSKVNQSYDIFKREIFTTCDVLQKNEERSSEILKKAVGAREKKLRQMMGSSSSSGSLIGRWELLSDMVDTVQRRIPKEERTPVKLVEAKVNLKTMEVASSVLLKDLSLPALTGTKEEGISLSLTGKVQENNQLEVMIQKK